MMLASICPLARRVLLLVFAGAVCVQAAERIIVDARLEKRLPAQPPGKLAPALDATLQLNGRLLGLTQKRGQAVIELPGGRDLSWSRTILSARRRFIKVERISDEPIDRISQLIVLYEPAHALPEAGQALADVKVRSRHLPGHYVVLDTGGRIDAFLLRRLVRLDGVRFVEPNYRYRLTASAPPNDPDYLADTLWGLVRIKAPAAWAVVHDSPARVALLDTGIHYTHPDLVDNVWENCAESGGQTGVDDDHNGCIDDIHGCDFVDGDGDPADTQGHGTAVAGIVAAVGNNGQGVVGVAWHAQLIAVRIFGSSGTDTDANMIAKAIDYAIANHARVLNASWAGPNAEALAVSDAITRAGASDALLVAAVDLRGEDIDQPGNTLDFPAAYAHDNIIAVMATTNNNATNNNEDRTASTNYGATSVDIGAPGDDIKSTTLGDVYTSNFGTSFATAHVTGAVALVWGHPAYRNKSALEVRQLILDHADPVATLSGRCVTGGRLNLDFLGQPAQTPQAPP